MKLIHLEEAYEKLDNLQERESRNPEPIATYVSLGIKSSKFAISEIPTIDPIAIIDEMIEEAKAQWAGFEYDIGTLEYLKSRLLNNQ